MARKKIPSADRRVLILAEAKSIFAAKGFDAATLQEIAKAAKISEALIYRHFPTKQGLYRAVLRLMIREQNANFADLALLERNTNGVLTTLAAFIEACLTPQNTRQMESVRILFASLAGDGKYAQLIYRRAIRLTVPFLDEALAAARAAGDLVGDPISATNGTLFVDHIGSMIAAYRFTARTAHTHEGNDAELLRQAVTFCARGFGIREDCINRFFDEYQASRPAA
ncbi:helix-turn-helix domain-containing protein [Sphingomonas sp. C3-2]|uniref:TetR/AcrR family transcriptional regulator n=1 Tax=Sphingomonas sp. C3-2 TaxID=3062169 RepID=UPI00294B6968|nr:helix-turn-helix domain-containing protein [Sphingomonas sp. C3-2]WOK36003.1 helix-turn-helix domain-containing protein [Sphingomonas sp. C3-2]